MAAKKKCSEKTIKILKTSALYYSFLALGLCLAIPGPTLLDLQQVVKTDTGKIAFIYLARSGSALVGSLVGGVLFDVILRKQLLLAACNMVMAISIFATPWTRSVAGLVGTWAVTGLALGALDTGSNVMCLKIWGKESPPFLQALHFVFGLGTFVAPLIAEPFLSNCNPDVATQQHNESTNDEVLNNLTFHENSTAAACDDYTIPPVTYAYSIIGVIATLAVVFLLILAVLFPDQPKQKKPDSEEGKPSKKPGLTYTIMVAVTTQVLIFLYCGIEIGYGQMIMTFAVKGDLKLSKSTASYVNALYWGSFTFFRGFAIPLTYKFSAFVLVFGDLLAVLISSVILVLYGSTYVEALWAGTFLLGIGCASFFPAVISWIECYIHVNNKIASLFVIAGCCGEMIVPLVVSSFIDTQPHILMYICLGCAVGGCIVAFCLWLLMTKIGKRT